MTFGAIALLLKTKNDQGILMDQELMNTPYRTFMADEVDLTIDKLQ